MAITFGFALPLVGLVIGIVGYAISKNAMQAGASGRLKMAKRLAVTAIVISMVFMVLYILSAGLFVAFI